MSTSAPKPKSTDPEPRTVAAGPLTFNLRWLLTITSVVCVAAATSRFSGRPFILLVLAGMLLFMFNVQHGSWTQLLTGAALLLVFLFALALLV